MRTGHVHDTTMVGTLVARGVLGTGPMLDVAHHPAFAVATAPDGSLALAGAGPNWGATVRPVPGFGGGPPASRAWSKPDFEVPVPTGGSRAR